MPFIPSAVSPKLMPCSQRLILLLGAVVFALAYTQAPLYFSNQHQYFVHGAAKSGHGCLQQDWLANTLDPTMAFSSLAAFVLRYLHTSVFYAIHFLLMMVYFASLLTIVQHRFDRRTPDRVPLVVLGCTLIVIHSGIIRLVSVRLFGIDYPWYLQSGVAGQYVLGPGLQPSAFGVLLISSIAFFLNGRNAFAVFCLGAACWMHATYLLPAALLTLTYMLQLYRGGKVRTAWQLGAAALLSVLPVVIDSALKFSPTSPESFDEAQRLLVEFRIPHHALILRWLDPVAGAQLALVGIALLILRRTKLFLILLVPLIFATLLTIIQAITGNRSLALLFPWRLSVVLVPIATCIIVSRLIEFLPERRWICLVTITVAVLASVGGIVIQVADLAYPSDNRELPALDFIRAYKRPGQVYLIPIRVPAVGSGPRGSVSLSFAPPPRPKDHNLIPVDLQRFRLYTEAPIYVDFKSIPYKDTEVLEWYRRLGKCQEWYQTAAWQSETGRAELKREGITHIVLPVRAASSPVDKLRVIYADETYQVCELVD